MDVSSSSVSGQLSSDNTPSEKYFPYIQLEPSVFQFMAAISPSPSVKSLVPSSR